MNTNKQLQKEPTTQKPVQGCLYIGVTLVAYTVFLAINIVVAALHFDWIAGDGSPFWRWTKYLLFVGGVPVVVLFGLVVFTIYWGRIFDSEKDFIVLLTRFLKSQKGYARLIEVVILFIPLFLVSLWIHWATADMPFNVLGALMVASVIVFVINWSKDK